MIAGSANGALSVSELQSLLVHLYRASSAGRYCPVLIWGEAGIGKSETVRRTSEALGVGFKDLRLGLFEAPDLLGVPRQQEVYPCHLDFEHGSKRDQGRRFTRQGLWNRIRDVYAAHLDPGMVDNPDRTTGWAIDQARKMGLGGMFSVKTVNSPPGWLPQPGTSGQLFLDELNRSQKDIRQGVFQLLLDRRIGEMDLPKRWTIVSAINPPAAADEEGAGGYEVAEFTDKAFLSRFCHVGLKPSVQEWLQYARRARVDPRIRAFVSQHGKKALGSDRPTEIPDLDPTPRSWTILSRVISDVPAEVQGAPPYSLDPELVPPVAVGLVGVNATRLWFAMRAVPDPVVTIREVKSDPQAALARLRKFLSYEMRDPETGRPVLGDDGDPILTRRSDLVGITFEDAQDALVEMEGQKRAGKPHDLDLGAAVLFLVQAGFTPVDKGGLGMSDMSFRYLKQWVRGLLPPGLLTGNDAAGLAAMTRMGVERNLIVGKLKELAGLRGQETTQ